MSQHCGYIALVGRPNVGKSTLLNRLMAQKLSITSKKPQTTRHTILGIHTVDDYQYVFVDTPGIHHDGKVEMNRMMNKTAKNALRDVDVVAFVVDGTHWRDEDETVLKLIKYSKAPCILLINKVDKIAEKTDLLPWLSTMAERHPFVAMIPISAKTGQAVDVFETTLKPLLPEGIHLFGEDQLTDRSTRFLCGELLREKIFRHCGQELPYSTIVDINSFQEEGNLITIDATILVDKPSHKSMVIGEKGRKLKVMATNARLDMEALLGQKVFLRVWCKVKSGWSDDARLLKQLGL